MHRLAGTVLVLSGAWGCGLTTVDAPPKVVDSGIAEPPPVVLDDESRALDTAAGNVYAELKPVYDAFPTGDTQATVHGKVWADLFEPQDLSVRWSSNLQGELSPPEIRSNGTFRWPASSLEPGWHVLKLEAFDPDGRRGVAEEIAPVCAWPAPQTFDSDVVGQGWKQYGHARWDRRGWLELTGNAQGRAGAIFWTERRVDPGDFKIAFRISTGGGINSGADGFAVTVLNVASVEELDTYVGAARAGGCLNYGVSGGWCGNMDVSAFHVEFDTWNNGSHDPTEANHIAITLDGDPGNHYLWTEVPTLENHVWRDVVVTGEREIVRVHVDGELVIDGHIPGFRFEGGYIGVSGSTGWATNDHRFDDLRLYDRCDVPGDYPGSP